MSKKQRTLFFSTNGAGLGHLNRCLAYASRMRGRAEVSFFSLASAIEIIEQFGFTAEYFVSHFWTSNTSYNWNCELALRLGMLLERVKPDVVVFDGTWPFQGFLAACKSYGKAKLVWSSRGLFKEDIKAASIDKSIFDLIIQPGELGGSFTNTLCEGKTLKVPPVFLLQDYELMEQVEARNELNLDPNGRYVLFSLGAGNINNISGISQRLFRKFLEKGYQIVWARAPITVEDVRLPPEVMPISVYPLVRYLRAFDVFVGATGYNTCCEVVQTQVVSLLIPNQFSADDQARRANLVAQYAPAVVSPCETAEQQQEAVTSVLQMLHSPRSAPCILPMNGAEIAAKAILKLATEGRPA